MVMYSMGGRAFGKTMPRLSLPTYSSISQRLVALLKAFYSQVEIPRCLPTKTSFGDVDILVAGEIKPFEPLDVVHSEFVVRNGNVLSFDFEGHQVDLLQYGELTDLKRFFNDFGDLGMLLGIMVSRYGLKLNTKGLYILLSNDKKLLLTSNLHSIFELLGMSLETWRKGFADTNDIFAFLGSCCVCSNGLRVNNKHMQRPGVASFLQFLTALNKEPEGKQPFRARAIHYFNKEPDIEAMEEEIKRKAAIKTKFNGRLVMDWTGVTGRDVGVLMSIVLKEVPRDTMLDMTVEDIRSKVMNVHAMNKATD